MKLNRETRDVQASNRRRGEDCAAMCDDGSGGQRVHPIHSHCEAHSQHSQQEMGEKFGITKTPTGNCKKTFRLLAGDTWFGLGKNITLFWDLKTGGKKQPRLP